MLFREMKIAGRANTKARTVPVVVSTDTPLDRGDYVEVLDHRPGAIDLSRGDLPLIESHDARKVNIGIVENLVSDGHRLRGVARFGNSTRADELLRDIVDNVVRSVSVGYEVLGRGEQLDEQTFRFKFKPFEVSVVSVPADRNAGFFRSKEVQVGTNTQHDGEQLERERVAAIIDAGKAYAKYISQRDIDEAIRNGRSLEQFKDRVIASMQSRHTDTSELHVGMTNREVERYSFGRAVRAAVTGNWAQAGFEREISQDIERRSGRSPEGFYVPGEFWRRDFNVGTSSEAGNLVATDLRGDLFVDALRNALVLQKLGLRILPGLSGNVDIPRKSGVSTLAALTEIGSASETAPATAKVTLSPKRFGAYIEVSKQALIQSAIALEAMLRDDLLQGFAVNLENQILNGSGTSPNILGIRNYTTIGSTTAGSNGATVAWQHIVDLETVCANSNAVGGSISGYVFNSRTIGKAKQVQRGTNMEFLIADRNPDVVNGHRFAVTNNIPSNLTKGTSTTVCSAAIFASDWSMGVLGLFGAPDVVVDPYTLAATGQVRITLNGYADFGIRQPAAFAKIEDLLTA